MACKNTLRFYLLIILLVSKNAIAEGYIGGLYTYTIIELPNSEEFTPTALVLKGGYDLHKYLAVELRVATGITSGKRSRLDIEHKIKIGTSYGGYLKLQAGGKEINPYIMFGYTDFEVEESIGPFTAKVNDSDTSYGLGIEGALSETTFFNLEYMQYFDKDEIKGTGIGVGITTRF